MSLWDIVDITITSKLYNYIVLTYIYINIYLLYINSWDIITMVDITIVFMGFNHKLTYNFPMFFGSPAPGCLRMFSPIPRGPQVV